jgi:flavin reductase (DIM6/NTAB) family NADH-FMN oxidoreductase RutF
MELPWNEPRSNKFVTIVGLITSSGSSGPNIMACEWTHHLSYKPGVIAVSLCPTKDNSWKYTSESRIWY